MGRKIGKPFSHNDVKIKLIIFEPHVSTTIILIATTTSLEIKREIINIKPSIAILNG